jgi:SynChlorMet cassette protein ScmC
MKENISSMRLIIGPLRYQYLAYDAWGSHVLSCIQQNLNCITFSGVPNRVIHVLEFSLTTHEHAEINADTLPERLSNILPEKLPRQGWKLTGDETGYMCWHHTRTSDIIWTYNTIQAYYQAPYQIPWQPIFEDMVEIGGGILHSGLSSLHGLGYLFLAPPGGGKTTALSRIPQPWKVLADDAVLVWPIRESFFASPLPTWSVLLGTSKKMIGIDRWQVGDVLKIIGAMILEKNREQDNISPLYYLNAISAFYRALIEHPTVLSNSHSYRKNLFDISCELAKKIPSWRLELTIEGKFWELIRPGYIKLPSNRLK